MPGIDVIVVGAGPAGLMAAGRAAEKGARVLVLEKNERAGRKLLITGKGRCNITNQSSKSNHLSRVYPDSRFLKNAYSRYFVDDLLGLLHDNGLETMVERGDRVFPSSEKSVDVLNALLSWVKSRGVEFRYNCKVHRLSTTNGLLTGADCVCQGKEVSFQATKVILCTGGNSYPATGSTGDGYRLAKALGHTIAPIRPALVSLETEGPVASRLQGLSLKNVKATVWVNGKKSVDDFGEMLFTHFGLSGPIILTLSRVVVDALDEGKMVEISIDLKPALDEEKLDDRLIRDLNENGKKQVGNLFKLWLPSLMIPVFIELSGVDPAKESHQVPGKERKKIRGLLKDFRFKITKYRSFKEAIITAGGIQLAEIDPVTMESKIIKNLYFAGEVMDLDADTGGYNLQIAWSTGWVAGDSCWT